MDSIVPPDRRVRILQLDVEGYEAQALQGAAETIRRCRPVLILRTMPAGPWAAAFLQTEGYRTVQKLTENIILRCH